MIVASVALSITGIGAPVAAILLGAGIGGLFALGNSIVSQGLSNGFGNINWGQVAFNGLMGMGIGAVMGSPLGGIVSGAVIGTISFVQSVGNDLFENGGDFGKVNWGGAVATGIFSGIMSGAGKWVKNLGNGIKAGLKALGVNGIAAIDALILVGQAIAWIGTGIAAVGRAIFKGIVSLFEFIFGGGNGRKASKRYA